MRICHNLPFLYVLFCFVFNVFYIKLHYYLYHLVLPDKGRFVLLSGRSRVRIAPGMPKAAKTKSWLLFYLIRIFFFLRIKMNAAADAVINRMSRSNQLKLDLGSPVMVLPPQSSQVKVTVPSSFSTPLTQKW